MLSLPALVHLSAIVRILKISHKATVFTTPSKGVERIARYISESFHNRGTLAVKLLRLVDEACKVEKRCFRHSRQNVSQKWRLGNGKGLKRSGAPRGLRTRAPVRRKRE